MTHRILSPIEARVLATLMEKARTVPDSYPLSLNSLVLGCNQKTSREPLMEVSDDDARTALDTLKKLSLVFEGSSSRVPRYEHNFQRFYGVSEPQAVLLGLLILRGPQTTAELRQNAERWYKYADPAAVEEVLAELQARGDDGGARFCVKLPRAAGAREQRWAHQLCGDVDLSAMAMLLPGSAESEGLLARVTALENEVAQLKATQQGLQTVLHSVCSALGMPSFMGVSPDLSPPGQK